MDIDIEKMTEQDIKKMTSNELIKDLEQILNEVSEYCWPGFGRGS